MAEYHHPVFLLVDGGVVQLVTAPVAGVVRMAPGRIREAERHGDARPAADGHGHLVAGRIAGGQHVHIFSPGAEGRTDDPVPHVESLVYLAEVRRLKSLETYDPEMQAVRVDPVPVRCGLSAAFLELAGIELLVPAPEIVGPEGLLESEPLRIVKRMPAPL